MFLQKKNQIQQSLAETQLHSDLPRFELYEIERYGSKKNAQRIHELLTITLELLLDGRRSLVFQKYCIQLAICCAASLSFNMKAKLTSPDPHHKDSYKRICNILNVHLAALSETDTKKPTGQNHRYVDFSHFLSVAAPRDNINCSTSRTYRVYAFAFGFSTFRLLLQRVVMACEQLHWLSDTTKIYKAAEIFLPHLTCFILGLELLFELGVVLRAMIRGESAYRKLIKDNRPFRMLYASCTIALVIGGLFNPICNFVLFAGLDLAHSLLMDYSRLTALFALRAQLRGDDQAEGPLMLPEYHAVFLSALNYKMLLHCVKMIVTALCLGVLCTGVAFAAINPFVSAICLLVGAGCAFINRMFMIMKLSETPGVPKRLEQRCKSQLESKDQSSANSIEFIDLYESHLASSYAQQTSYRKLTS